MREKTIFYGIQIAFISLFIEVNSLSVSWKVVILIGVFPEVHPFREGN